MKAVKILVFLIPVIGFVTFIFISTDSVENENYVPYQAEESTDTQSDFESRLVNEVDFAKVTREDIPTLETEILAEGTGEDVVAEGDTVRANYRGWIANSAEEFDSSFKTGQSIGIEFSLLRVIAGWQQGVPGMKVGEVRRIYIPSELGYGEQGTPNIPPNSDLIFDVELVEIK